MATGCSGKEFESRYDKEMYYDEEYEEYCERFDFAVSRVLSHLCFPLFSDFPSNFCKKVLAKV